MLKGWRTILVNAGIIAAAFITQLNDYIHAIDLSSLGFDAHLTARVATGIAIVNILLRLITTTPVGQKE